MVSAPIVVSTNRQPRAGLRDARPMGCGTERRSPCGTRIIAASPLRRTFMRTPHTGFTLIELMVAVAVVAILAALALPSMQAPLVRQQIVDSAPLINAAKG